MSLAEGTARVKGHPLEARHATRNRLEARHKAREFWLKENVSEGIARGVLRKTRKREFNFVKGERAYYWTELPSTGQTNKGFWLPATLRDYAPERGLVTLLNDRNREVTRSPEMVVQFAGAPFALRTEQVEAVRRPERRTRL